jgi:hypothetical protein
MFIAAGYKHMVPPGLRQCLSNTLLPHYATVGLAHTHQYCAVT